VTRSSKRSLTRRRSTTSRCPVMRMVSRWSSRPSKPAVRASSMRRM
jgi:hypothetical protein